MVMDFSGAERQNDFSTLIPQGTLCWGMLKVRPFNLDAGLWETPSKNGSGNKYLDCEVIIQGGKYNLRRVWTRIGTGGSEKYVNMGRSQTRAILEVGKQASEQNPAGYAIDSYSEVNGLQVAFKVKEEPEQNGYDAKNEVAVFLSPVDPVTKKDFERLVAGDTEPKGKQNIRSAPGGGVAAQAAPTARWAQGGDPNVPAPAQPAANPNQAPAWLATPDTPAPAEQPPPKPTSPIGRPQTTAVPQPTTAVPAQANPNPPWATGQPQTAGGPA